MRKQSSVSQLCVDEDDSVDEDGLNLWFEMRASEVLGFLFYFLWAILEF